MHVVYLDNAATTRVAPKVAERVLACMRDDFGNPSSAHRVGIAATQQIAAARLALLSALGDERGEAGDLVWTSGGTEADALGVLGAARARAGRGRKVVATAIEHPAVLRSADWLVRRGYTVTQVKPGPDGVVAAADVLAAITTDTVVVALMLVNNELGTLQPITEVAPTVRAGVPALAAVRIG